MDLLAFLFIILQYQFDEISPTVAVIDTAVTEDVSRLVSCNPSLNRKFQSGNSSYSHGTGVASAIHEFSKGKACQYLIEASDGVSFKDEDVHQALLYALSLNPTIVNLSYSGRNEDLIESKLVSQLIDNGVFVVAAAGNKGANIDEIPEYPAKSDNRVIIASNYEPTTNKGIGVVYTKQSYFNKGKIFINGSSSAAAIVSGSIANILRENYEFKTRYKGEGQKNREDR